MSAHEDDPLTIQPLHYKLTFVFNKGFTNLYMGHVSMHAKMLHQADYFDIHFAQQELRHIVGKVVIRAEDGGEYYEKSRVYNPEYQTYRIKMNKSMDIEAHLFIEMDFQGIIGEASLDGIFFGNSASEGADGRLMVATHCKYDRARKVFPCVDLPYFRADFDVKVQTSTDVGDVWTNGNASALGRYSDDGDQRTWTFQRSPSMPIHGFALCLSRRWQYEQRNGGGGDVRVTTRSPQANNARDVAQFASDCLAWYATTFEVPNTSNKLEIFAVDDKRINHEDQEYWKGSWAQLGIMFVPESVFTSWDLTLYDLEKFNPECQRFHVAVSIARLWFNQMCSPNTWKYFYVHDGLAVYYATRCNAALTQAPYVADYFFYSALQYEVMQNDTPETADVLPMQPDYSGGVNDRNYKHIETIYSTARAGVFMRMLAGYSSALNRFDSAVTELLKLVDTHGDQASFDFKTFIDTVLKNDRYKNPNDSEPFVSMKLERWATNTFFPNILARYGEQLSHSLIYLDEEVHHGEHDSVPHSQWPVAMIMGVANRGLGNTMRWKDFVFGNNERSMIVKDDYTTDTAYTLNYTGDGFYSVEYSGSEDDDPTMFSRLMLGYKNKWFSEVQRYTLVRDINPPKLIKVGDVRTQALPFLNHLGWENSPLVWMGVNEAFGTLVYQLILHGDTDGQTMVGNALVANLTPFLDPSNKYQWFTNNRNRHYILEIVNALLALINHKPQAERLEEVFARCLHEEALLPEDQSFVKRLAFNYRGRRGGVAGFEELKTIYARSREDDEKILCLQSMLMNEDPLALERALEFALEEAKKLGDVGRVLKGVTPISAAFVAEYLEENEMIEEKETLARILQRKGFPLKKAEQMAA